jgi:hypothetical protein
MLYAEARARAGDPGRVVIRRLSNAECNNTIRDLTGVDLEPTRDFPADGAAGEGFTNAGDALVTSPALLGKYLNAAKEIASHAVLLPDGFRFSPSKTQRDWTDESLASIRAFYAPIAPDGKLPLRPYLAALVRHREDLAAGKMDLDAVAATEKLSPKYLRILWETLSGAEPSFPLDRIRALWRQATPQMVDPILAEIAAWQGSLWTTVKIGSYVNGKTQRQEATNPAFAEAQTIKLQPKGAKGDVVLRFSALEFFPAGGEGAAVVWQRPRFVSGSRPPLLLKDYAQFGGRFEVDLRSAFARAAEYLEAAADRKPAPDLDPAWLKCWIDVLGLEAQAAPIVDLEKMAPVPPLEKLDTPAAANDKWPAIRGWRLKRGELPALLSNASDKTEQIPGRAPPHKIVVHPSPDRYVAVAWSSPIDGRVRIDAKVAHAHPGCGNGIAWWIEVRRADRGAVLAEGVANPGQETPIPSRELTLAKGDTVVLAVDPREGNHVCDLTEVNLVVTEVEGGKRAWDLGRDTADTILESNPHADGLGNREVWGFVAGPALKGSARPAPFKIPPDSILGKWRAAASDPKRLAELPALAQQVQALLVGDRPVKDKSPDQVLYDSLAWVDGPLFHGVDLTKLAKPSAGRYGFDAAWFKEADLVASSRDVLDVRLPAALFRDYEFVVEARLAPGGPDRVVQFRVSTAPPGAVLPLDGKSACVADPTGEASKKLVRGLDDFRRAFPLFVCFPQIVPTDETVCLKMYHREDEPLARLFLDDEQARRLERLWSEHRFITQWPVTEDKYLPQFIGFLTQDAPKELLVYFQGQQGAFHQRAEAFEKEVGEAAPKQVDALVRFAGRAYRRPLSDPEEAGFRELYAGLRKKEMAHAEAIRTVLARILVSPSFLFRLENAAPGTEASPVSDAELATRLSYFLWATMPDAELLRVAAEGRLRDPAVLDAQVGRMLKDPKVRGLAVEFATQWLHVRTLRQNREKNEKLFPMFDDRLREALFEESVLFFQHLFQEGRPFADLVDADYTFLNEKLAKHYGIPGVAGPQWRRVDGVKKHGRGGALTLGSVLTQESGASRTSPVLRGNWLVETMLGEKLPKPPANVPRLPEDEAGAEGTVREMVARHTRVAECAVCHVRIDPFGFALERYDPIGRFREKDLGGRPIDVKVQLKDGTEFEGLDGLRGYLLKKRMKDVERTFSQKLLGYALGRSVTLSDQVLVEEMVAGFEKEGGRFSDAVMSIVRSKQFRCHRGLEATREE